MSNLDKKINLTPAEICNIFKSAYEEGYFGAPLKPRDAKRIVKLQEIVLGLGGYDQAPEKVLRPLAILTRKVRSENPQK